MTMTVQYGNEILFCCWAELTLLTNLYHHHLDHHPVLITYWRYIWPGLRSKVYSLGKSAKNIEHFRLHFILYVNWIRSLSRQLCCLKRSFVESFIVTEKAEKTCGTMFNPIISTLYKNVMSLSLCNKSYSNTLTIFDSFWARFPWEF